MMRRIAAAVVSLSLLACGLLGTCPIVSATGETASEITADRIAADKYWTYVEEYKVYPAATEVQSVDIASATVRAGKAVWDEGEEAWEVAEKSEMDFSLTVPEAGLYHLAMDYMCSETSGTDILRTVYINGEMPYDEAREISLRRLYTNGEGGKDAAGNDIRPSQIEVQTRQSVLLRDYMGYITEPLLFYLNKGENKVTVTADSAPCLLYGLSAIPAKAEAFYVPNPEGEITQANPIVVQGEDAVLKTSPTLYAKSDRITADTYPSSPVLQLLNVIGGDSWSQPNQAILWNFQVKTAGWYTLKLKVRQNISRGVISTRDIYLDGEMPYVGMKAWSVSFDADWQYLTLEDEDGDPLHFYLEAGPHQLEMVAVLGIKAEKIRVINEQLEEMNDVYTQIMMVTGPTPDVYRDYKLRNLIPEVLARFPKIKKEIITIRDWYLSYAKMNTSNNAVLDTIIRQLDKFEKDEEEIIKGFGAFKSNISALADWVLEARKQPLEIDYFVLEAVGGETHEREDATWWERFLFGFSRFYYSFVSDYSTLGGAVDKEAITVWIPTGRDQAQVLKRLIDSTFTSRTNIPVNLQLTATSLLTATAAGRGPDVALSNGDGTAVEYGMRKAVRNLAEFEDFDEISERFMPQRMVPFYHEGACYALPETQSFEVLFYRKDILEKLGLSVPQTWTELTATIAILLKNNMGFAMPSACDSYYWILYQYGGAIFNETGTKTVIDSEAGVEAFRFWTNLFKNYELPISYNFLARFRTGEYPLIIADFTTANSLAISAPEIRGLWGFAPVPGIIQEDGTLDNAVTFAGNCTVMLKDTDQPEESWEFMKWWTEADTQTAYGREMESILGASARYNSANVEAFRQTAWTTEQKSLLFEQMEDARGIPQVPGGYFMSRHLTNAFRKVVYESGDPQDVMYDYVYTINQEITSKRKEFGLGVE